MKFIPCIVGVAMLLTLSSCGNKTTQDSTSTYQIPDEVFTLAFGTEIGERAPEIILNDTKGKEVKLSSLLGKVVLVDFWASWCTPCRKESPELVLVYTEYNTQSLTAGEGFEIYSVSLDRNEEAWKKAIEADGMNWTYNMGDMLGAKTQAALDYGVQMIPANYLLDKNGVIIAKNLRGIDLATKLEELAKLE